MSENITEKLMSRIRAGRVKMRTRLEVLARTSLHVLAAVVILLVAFFLAGFVALTVRTGGLMELPGFGARGVASFLYEFPWLIVCLLAALMLGVELYARRWSFAYRLPALATLGALVLTVAAAGLALDAYLEATCPRGPLVGEAARRFKALAPSRPDVLHRGAVQGMTGRGYRIVGEDGQVFEVLVTPDTRVVAGHRFLEGERLVIFGSKRGGLIEAHGVMRRPSDSPAPPLFVRLFGDCPKPDMPALRDAPLPGPHDARWEKR